MFLYHGVCHGKTHPIRYESGMSIFIAFLSLTGPVGSLLSSLTFIDGIPDFWISDMYKRLGK